MDIPRFWAREESQASTPDGKPVRFFCWRWSDVSVDQARAAASARRDGPRREAVLLDGGYLTDRRTGLAGLWRRNTWPALSWGRRECWARGSSPVTSSGG